MEEPRDIGRFVGWADEQIFRLNARAKEHGYARRVWQGAAYVLGALTAAAGAFAAWKLFSGADEGTTKAIIGGAAGVLAAILGALTNVFSPQSMARRHRDAGVGFEVLREGFEDLKRLEVGGGDYSAADARYRELRNQQLALVKSAPEISDWTRGRAAGGG